MIKLFNLLFILSVNNVIAQSLPSFTANNNFNSGLLVKSLTVDDGLPAGYVTGIAQDKQGFIWLGTLDGLARYDGRSIKVFHHEGSDSTTLSTNVITGVHIDRQNNLWLIHDNGAIDLFDPVSEHVRHLSNEKTFSWLELFKYYSYQPLQDLSNRYWIITNNHVLQYFTWKNPKPTIVSFSPNEIPTALYLDKSGKIWVYTNIALYTSVHETEFKKITDLPVEISDHGNVEEDNDYNLIIGFADSVIAYNILQNKWILTRTPYGVPSGRKYFAASNNGAIYMQSGNKMYRLNNDFSVSLLWVNETHPGDFTAFTIDRSNVMWVGTNTFGARLINLFSTGFHSFNSKYFFNKEYLPPNTGFDKGVLDDWFENYFRGFVDYNVRSCYDKNGVLWVIDLPDSSNLKGMQKKFNNPGSFPIVAITKENTSVFEIEKNNPASRITDLTFDAENRCWVIMHNGNDRDTIFQDTIFEADLQKKILFNPIDLKSKSDINYVTAVNNEIWIVYVDGLQSFNTETKQSVFYKDQPGTEAFRNAYLLMAVPDPVNKNILWITSRGNGLIKFDLSTKIAKAYTQQQGLPNNTVYAIVPDRHGYFWCSSNKGIFRFNPADYSILSFTVKDGLQGNEFNRFQYISFPEGHIAFGGTQGWTVFHPDSINVDHYQPQIALTDLEVNNTSLSQYPEWKNISLSGLDSLSLPYNKNFIGFHYAGLQYNNVDKLQYRYMLEGIDKDWVKAGTQNSATYTGLPPGNYIFKVNATNTAGIWSSHIKTLNITILPPWWKTWWAYSLYTLLFIGGIWAFIRLRTIQYKERQKGLEIIIDKRTRSLKESQAQLIQSEKMASLGELTAGIAHEIQNPLNFVNNFSEVNAELIDELKNELATGNQLQAIEIADNIKENEEKINYHGKRADSIVKGMLQHSRKNTGQKESTEINSLANEYLRLSYHGLRAKDKSFDATMETDFDNSIGTISIIPQDIGRVLLNLYNNAFYAVMEKKKTENEKYKPTVSVTTKKINNAIELTVKDNGNGIPQKVMDKIFQPFFTTKPTGEGTGLGLSLSYDIIKAHRGELKVESKEGEGAKFIIQLPL